VRGKVGAVGLPGVAVPGNSGMIRIADFTKMT
jgi:hypothetical protein